MIKRFVPEYEQDFLWAHTREIRERRASRTKSTADRRDNEADNESDSDIDDAESLDPDGNVGLWPMEADDSSKDDDTSSVPGSIAIDSRTQSEAAARTYSSQFPEESEVLVVGEDVEGNVTLPLSDPTRTERTRRTFWIPQATPDGRLFYFNTETGESSTELPLEQPSSETKARDTLESVKSNPNEERTVFVDQRPSESGTDPTETVNSISGDRWVQIRKNALERMAQTQHEKQSSGGYGENRNRDEESNSEETIESRIARIKARVAELTGKYESGP